MARIYKKQIIFVLTTLFVLSVACQAPTSPGVVSTLTSIVPTTAIATSAPTATDDLPTSTAPAQANPTASTSPTETITFTKVINAENVSSLLADSPIALPEWPELLLWPGASLSFPEAPDLHPDLLTRSGAALYPVTFNPPEIHDPIPLPLNGNQVLAFSPDASSLVVSDPSQTGVYTPQGQQMWLFPDTQPIYGVGYSDDGRYIVTTSDVEWKASIYDSSNGQPIASLTGFTTAAPVYGVIIAPGGEAAAWYARATLQFQDVASGEMHDAVHFEDFIGPILFTPDGQRLVLYAAGNLMVYDPKTGEQLAKQTLSETLSDLDVSPDGELLAGAYGQAIQFWDARTLIPLAQQNTQSSLARVAFSPNGENLVTVSNDQQLMIWQVP